MASLEGFLSKWAGSEGSEKANAQLFFTELCDVLELPHPSPATNDPERDDYVFERRLFGRLASGQERVGWADVYRKGCFVLESKQGASGTGKGFAKRGTKEWSLEMQKALGQALGYAQTLPEPPPFLIVVDVGHVFELHATFDGSTHWRAFPDPPSSRIYLHELRDEAKRARLRAALSEPASLDPSKHQERVTREIAAKIAELAKGLEKQHAPELVARFLMRCLFTMFAEDVGLFETGAASSTTTSKRRRSALAATMSTRSAMKASSVDPMTPCGEPPKQKGASSSPQDLDFSDTRKFVPGSHHGVLLVRLPDSEQWRVTDYLTAWFSDPDASTWTACVVVATPTKVRVVRAAPTDE